MEVEGTKHENQHVLMLKKIVYALKQASNNWYDMLKKGLQIRGFRESVAGSCVFLKGPNKKTASKLSSSKCTFAGSGHPSKGPARTLMEGGNAIIDQFRKDNVGIIVLVTASF